MRDFKKIFIVLIILMLLAMSCTKREDKESSDKVSIAVTLDAYSTFLKFLIEDNAEIITVIPVNADPHTYDANIKQIMKISNAEIYFTSGLEIEQNIIEKAYSNNKNLKIVALFQEDLLLPRPRDIHTKEHKHRSFKKSKNKDLENLIVPLDKDAHFWFDWQGLVYSVDLMTRHLLEIFPELTSLITSNREKLILAINNTYTDLNEIAKNISLKQILVYHPSYQYLFKNFGLQQVPIQIDGKEPNLRQLYQINQMIADGELAGFILMQPQYNSESVKIIQEKFNLELEQLDPLGANILETLEEFKGILQRW